MIPIIVKWCGWTKRIEVPEGMTNKRAIRKLMRAVIGIPFRAEFTWNREVPR